MSRAYFFRTQPGVSPFIVDRIPIIQQLGYSASFPPALSSVRRPGPSGPNHFGINVAHEPGARPQDEIAPIRIRAVELGGIVGIYSARILKANATADERGKSWILPDTFSFPFSL